MRVIGLIGLMALGVSAATARPLPGPTVTEGPNCHALSRASGLDTLYVGTVLGGQNRRGTWGDGTFRDYRTFQGCFVSEAICQDWVARQAAHHPMPPGYARCTRVFVGLTPDGTRVFVGLTPDGTRPARGPVVQTKY